jgi:hypothetical protein
MAESIYNVI